MAQRKGGSSNKGSRSGQKLRANAQAATAMEPSLWDSSLARDMAGLVLAVFAVASLIAVASPSSAPAARALAGFYHLGFGIGGYLIPLAILAAAALVFARDTARVHPRAVVGGALIFVSVISILVVATTPDSLVLGVTVSEADLASSGGYLGFWVASALCGLLGKPIAVVVLLGCAVAGCLLIGLSISGVAEGARARLDRFRESRRLEVNETPWGDEPPVVESPRPKRGARRRPAAGPDPSQALTRVMGEAPTRVIEDVEDVEDGDDEPFVDLSAQLAAERAETEPLPFDSAAAVERAKPGNPVGEELSAREPVPAAAADAAETAGDAPDDAPSAPIPSFLLNPRSAAAGEGGRAVSEPERVPDAAAAPAEGGEDRPADGSRSLPPISMLRHNPNSASAASSDKELRQTAESLQATLVEFKLHSSVVGWISGPTVTTFKVQPGEGERVSRIQSLEDDIALALAAQSVRIFAPIPGTSLVGIEIPNRKRQNVFLGDVLPYVQGGPLELAIGRDAEGAPIVADLAKMPHLLIAGTTGSGKSVMINSIVSTLLMRTLPEDVRLIMVDPKRVELAGYNGLPHLYVPVVTEPKQAASALSWGVSEMERRLKVFERIGVRNIATFNSKQATGEFEHYDNPPSKMPYLVIIIDELSDLMMVAGKDVEASIVRIAQLGRAAGIHLIVATQRPSSNVVTGLIKANITNRIAFNVATGIDSRVIIDQVGAEKLTGLGDMLFSKVGWGKPKRIQGCFVSDEEIAGIVDFVKEQGEADYHEEILSAVSPATLGGGAASHEPSEDDPLLWDAAHIVVESQLGSTSGLQRRLKVGYARAGRIMDMLEEKGVVGPPDGSKPREVLLDEEGLAELEEVEARMASEDGMGGF